MADERVGPVTTVLDADPSGFNAGMETAISRIFSFDGALLAAGATLGFFASKALADSIDAMSDFETAMAGVEKVTGFADDKMAVVSEDIRDIAIRFGIAHEQVAEFAEAAARAGIRGEQEIANFTETVAKMNVALDGIEGDEIADQFARLIGFLGVSAEKSETVASVINELGNRMPTDAGRIIDSTSRMAADFRALGLTAPEILGLAGATSTLRESANRAATRMRRVAQELISPSRLDQIAQLFGITGDQLARLRDDAPIQTLVALGQIMGSETQTAGELADALGVRVSSELRNVGLRAERVQEAIAIANDEFGETQSINEEVAIFLDTLNKKWDRFQSIIHDTAIEIGQFLKPAILGILGVLTGLAEDFRELNRATEGAFGAFLLLSGAIFGAALAISSFATIFKVAFGKSFTESMAKVGRLAGRILLLMGALSILTTAWKNDWLGIRTTIEDVIGFINPKLEKAASFLGDLGDAAKRGFSGLDEATGGIITKFAKFLGIVGSLAVVGNFLRKVFFRVTGVISGMTEGVLPKLISGWTNLISKLKFVDRRLAFLLRRFGLVGRGVLKFAGIIGIIITLAELLWVAWRDNIDNFRNFVLRNLAEIRDLFNEEFGKVTEAVRKTLDFFRDRVVKRFGFIVFIIKRDLERTKRIITNVLSAAKRLWEIFGDDIVAIVKFFFGLIFLAVKNAIILISGVLRAFLALLREEPREALDILLDTFERIFGNILDFIIKWTSGFLDEGIGNFIEGMKTALKEFGDWLIGNSFIQDTFNAVTDWIKNIFKPNILGTIGDIVSDIASKVQDGLDELAKLDKAKNETSAGPGPGVGNAGGGDDDTSTGGGGGGCFLPDESVLTPDGLVEISTIEPGQSVTSYDAESGEFIISVVGEILIHTDDHDYEENPVCRLEVKDAEGEISETFVTTNHLYYTPDSDAWIPVGEIPIGDTVLTESGRGEIVGREITDRNPDAIYNLHMEEGPSNYLVNGTVVHNAKLARGFHTGGLVSSTGLALVQEGEKVLPPAGKEPLGSAGKVVNITVGSINANSRQGGREAARGLKDELKSNNIRLRGE